MTEPNAILAISSTDRYTTSINGKKNQPFSNVLQAEFQNVLPFSNDFSITAPGALLNGYISKIIISQIQLQYNLPTIQVGNNDAMIIGVETAPGTGQLEYIPLQFPYGFYTPNELAIMLQVQLDMETTPDEFSVTYSQGDPKTTGSPGYDPYPPGYFSHVGFLITSQKNRTIAIPNIITLKSIGLTQVEIDIALKTCRIFGFNVLNTFPAYEQRSWNVPLFLYTPYIDIYSDALTNYQKVKDTSSAVSSRKGLVARIYLSNTSSIQTTSPNGALGTSPFVATYDFKSPKVIGWSPDTAINSLDFQLRDCYGDLLYVNEAVVDITGQGHTSEIFNTEFQITLLCVEG
jgi:hypothetical protein